MNKQQIEDQIRRGNKYMEYITDMGEMSKVQDEIYILKLKLKKFK